MLNLSNPIVYTAQEDSLVDSLMDPNGSYQSLTGPQLWSINTNAAKSLKNRIIVWSLINQRCHCAYCERLLESGGTFIDHIAPKSKHRLFVFEPLNLVASCGICNSPKIKGEIDTLVPPRNPVYESNNFTIVHPFLDNPDLHIVFTDDTRTTFDKARCSSKGIFTINFFHWDKQDAVISRLKEAPYRNEPQNLIEYVTLVSTYK